MGDDLRKLEVYLQGGKVAYWTEMEDFVLSEYFHSTDTSADSGKLFTPPVNNVAYAKLVKVKGPEEVLNRKYFLKI